MNSQIFRPPTSLGEVISGDLYTRLANSKAHSPAFEFSSTKAKIMLELIQKEVEPKESVVIPLG